MCNKKKRSRGISTAPVLDVRQMPLGVAPQRCPYAHLTLQMYN